MDGHQFDDLLRAAFAPRRSVLGMALAAGAAISGHAPATARKKKKKPCLPCKTRKKGKCRANLPNGTICAGGTCQDGACAPPSCNDGVKNGKETGVDCGGPDCPRCPNGQGCVSRDDCRSAMCDLQVSICGPCKSSADCGEDQSGTCYCYESVKGEKICAKGYQPAGVTSCTLCPAPNFCWQPVPNDIFCVEHCGA